MYDVNPLGPMMHLKQIDREALAVRAAMTRDSSKTISIRAWILGALKRPFTSLRPEVSVGDRFNVSRQ